MFKRYASLLLAVVALTVLASASPALAASPWWHLTPSSLPSYLPANGQGTVIVNATNLGDADVEGEGADGPIVFTDTLPPGLKALGISAAAGPLGNHGPGQPEGLPIECPSFESVPLTCTSVADLPPYDQIVVKIAVEVLPGASLGAVEVNQASITGGGAPSATVSRPVTVSDEPTPFGLQSYELDVEAPGGIPDTQAGSHPFQVTSTVVLNKALQEGVSGNGANEAPIALPKDFVAKLPAGMIGNPTPLQRCSLVQFLAKIGTENATNACPTSSVVGVASVLVDEPDLGTTGFTVPLYNLDPAYGEPARFGFYIPISQTTVLLDTSVRSGPGEDYGITVTSPNTEQIAGLLSSQITFWGVPGDSIHNKSRGWRCVIVPGPCDESGSSQEHPPGFLIQPTSCSGEPLQSSIAVDSWVQPADFVNVPVSAGLPTQNGCNRLAFTPTMKTEPTSDSAASPSGLDFNLYFKDEGLTSAEGDAQSQLKNTVVVLPEGFTINPSAGVGLTGCTEADYARETVGSAPGAGCPNESKLGTVEIETPLLTQKINGSIFIATPYQNPSGSLVALYVVAKNPETGILIKLPGKVDPNPVTGRLTTTFENNPQLPFDHFNFHFREGQQAPLVTPATCGTYSTQAQLTPWSEPTTTLTDTSSFTITSGVGGGACPSGNVPPFHPGIEAGTVNNNASAFSSFYLHLTRGDADQEVSGFSTSLATGLTGDLTGLPFCSEAEIDAVRGETGAQAEAHPICPASEVGHSLVGTGVGAVLAYVPGTLYWAGPFQGAPFSLVSVTSARVGPFDLGTVVLRFGLKLNPYTTQISVSPSSSEPIPYIIKGIVTHVRDIRVYVDRPHFIINPSSCEPMAISSTLTADEGGSATVSSPFQTASCANLKFSPKFSASTQAKTSRAAGASLTVKVVEPSEPQGTQSWISTTKVELPKQLPSRLTTLQKACTAKQFEINPAGCPAASMIGHAKVTTPILPVPLEGPAIFVSHGGEAFPSLEFVLQGYGVEVILVGSTYISKSGVTSSTFKKTIDDQPFSTFELTLPEGPYSALAANGNLCALTTTRTVTRRVTVRVRGHRKTVTRRVKQTTPASLQMPTELVGWNGAEIHQVTPVTVTGCPKARPAKTKTKKKSKKK